DMGAQLAPATTMTKQKLSFATINVKEAGYLFVYLSYDNNSNNWVYFDDFKITHTPTNVIQYNEYYPFGLSTSNSWTREGSFNDYLYNAGSELNASSGWYETLFRGYDPVLGRFMQVDPMASALPSVSPYNFGLNDPVYFNDPMGDYVQKRIPPMYVGRGLNDIFGGAGGSGFYGSLMSGYSVERDARVMSRRDFLMFYGVADSYGRINESRRSEVTTAAAAQNGTSLVWCSDCETGTVTGGTSVINGVYHSYTFVETGAWVVNSAALPLTFPQGEPNIYAEISNSFNEVKYDYMLAEGVGLSATFYAQGFYSVRNINGKYYFNASAAAKTLAKHAGDIEFKGVASMLVNGKLVRQTSFVYGDGYNVKFPEDYTSLGALSMELPTTGTVTINLNSSYHRTRGSQGNRHSAILTIPVHIRTVGLPRN